MAIPGYGPDMLLVEIKDFKALIDNKPFFDEPAKNKEEVYEKLVEMSRNYDYTTGNLLDFLYHQNYYKFSSIFIKTSKYKYSQQINFLGKLEEDDGAAMFFIAEKKQKTVLNFSLNSLNVIE